MNAAEQVKVLRALLRAAEMVDELRLNDLLPREVEEAADAIMDDAAGASVECPTCREAIRTADPDELLPLDWREHAAVVCDDCGWPVAFESEPAA